MLQETDQHAEAESLLRQALEIRRTTLGEEHPRYATSLNNLARILQETDQSAEAEPLYRQALEIRRTTLGAEHPDYAVSLNNLARILQETDQSARQSRSTDTPWRLSEQHWEMSIHTRGGWQETTGGF